MTIRPLWVVLLAGVSLAAALAVLASPPDTGVAFASQPVDRGMVAGGSRAEGAGDGLFQAPAEPPTATAEQLAALQAILALPEFQAAQGRTLVDQLLDPLRSWLRWLVSEIVSLIARIFEPVMTESADALLYGIVGAALAVLIVVGLLLRRLMAGTLAGDAVLADVPTAGLPRAAAELALARELAQAGDARQAIHHHYRAVLLRLDECEHLPFDGSLTNRELLPRVSDAPDLARPFADLVARFDRLWYGQTECSAEEYADFAQRAERVWQAAGIIAPVRADRPGPTRIGAAAGASSGAR